MSENAVPHPKIVSQQEWLAARKLHLAHEKAMTRQLDQLHAERRRLPMVKEHGLSVFFRLGDDLFHTYSAYARGTESLTDAYGLLDTTPYGRQQDFEDSPAGWPQRPTYG